VPSTHMRCMITASAGLYCLITLDWHDSHHPTLEPAGSARLDNDGNRGGALISNFKKVLSLQREIIYSSGRHKALLMRCGPQKNIREAVMTNAIDAMHASYFLALHRCPNCKEEIFAAEGASLSSKEVKYRWRCDLCDHAFQTTEPVTEPT